MDNSQIGEFTVYIEKGQFTRNTNLIGMEELCIDDLN
jgi:hypothetical protein